VGGEWEAAAAEVEEALRRLSDPPHPAVGMAHYQLGELHRLRGNWREAEEAYRLAHAAGRDPHPGLALLRLASGRADDAAAAIGAALEATGDDRVVRARLLPAQVEIMLALGRHEEAAAAAGELDELAANGSATMLEAVAAQTRGSLLLASDDARASLGPLQHALDAWQRLGAPFEAAEVRVLLAAACRQLDDRDRAELECGAARVVFESLGAGPALARIDDLLAGLAESRSVGERIRHGVVTARELDVLRLVAAGRTNRDIADELAISVKTVERHLGNVFTKLGVANRAAATAHAYARGLL
jgi:DNA-binding CsgD family transcriptional regulator